MTKGLLWLPLLAVFCWLTWAGWNEYRKLEAYQAWAAQFDHAKYDIYAVLGQKDSEVTWGEPARRGPINLQTFSLQQVEAIRLLLDDQVIEDMSQLPERGRRVGLAFLLQDGSRIVVPFTELSLAVKWHNHLQNWQVTS